MKKTNTSSETPKTRSVRAAFVRGIRGSDPILHDPRPQVAFVGRSNVGKSSTINAILGRVLARTSGTPGKTQEINFFDVEGRGYVVDLPGYGYAKIPASDAEKIRKHILWYLGGGEVVPALIVLIIDAKVGITDFDRELIRLVSEEGHPLYVVANKVDKLNQRERALLAKRLAEESPDISAAFFSAATKENLAEIRATIFSALGVAL